MPIVRLVTDGDPNAEVVSVSLDNPRIDVSKMEMSGEEMHWRQR
jgi:hypothetical protein